MTLRIFNLLIFVFLFKVVLIVGQEDRPDEYKNVKDTVGLNKLIKKAKQYQFSNPDSFIYILDIVEDNAKKLSSTDHVMLANFFKGSYYLGIGDYKVAIQKLQFSLQLSKDLKNKKYINYNHLALSSVYMFLAYYPIAQEHMITALKSFEEAGDLQGAAGVYLNMTFINVEQKDYELANKNGQLAYENYQKIENNLGIARALLNLGEVNLNLKDYTESLRYSKKALQYTKLSNQPSMNGIIYQNIAKVYLELNQLDSSFVYFNKSIEATKDWGNSYSLAECMQGMAKAFAKQNEIKKAIAHALISFQIADSTNLAEVKADAASQLSDYYSRLVNYKTSLEYKNIASHINDSLFTEKKYKVQNEMEAMYQSQKKEQQIETLSKEKQIEVLKNRQSKYYIISLLIILFASVIAAVLFIGNSRLKASKKTIELEQKLLRSQMNPHFIFNAVSSIQEFIMHKNPLEASSYLSNFAKLMRSILNNSSTEFISLQEEIETLDHYLKLQKLRFADKFEYEIIVNEELETEELAIPPMLGQPFIENAIKHGIAKKIEGVGKVIVQFSGNDKSLWLKIMDNGIGIDSKESGNMSHQSMATKITQSRINNFKKTYKKGVNFNLGNVFDESGAISGVQVIFELPVRCI